MVEHNGEGPQDWIIDTSLRLLANGHEPIPILDKRPLQSRWTRREITPESIRDEYDGAFWPVIHDIDEGRTDRGRARERRLPRARRRRARSSGWHSAVTKVNSARKRFANGVGLRVRGFGAVDADVDDEATQDMIANVLCAHLGEAWETQHLQRAGNGAKLMFISGISSNAPVPPTSKLVKPGDDPAGRGREDPPDRGLPRHHQRAVWRAHPAGRRLRRLRARHPLRVPRPGAARRSRGASWCRWNARRSSRRWPRSSTKCAPPAGWTW